jgi:hypothetical protein
MTCPPGARTHSTHSPVNQFESVTDEHRAKSTNASARTERPRELNSGREFRIGLLNAIATTIIAAIQAVITRYGAERIDPMLFCAGSMTVAGSILAIAKWRRGEIRALVTRQWTPHLVALSMTG